jgi:DNA topoisomerase-3
VVAAIQEPYRDRMAPGTGQRPIAQPRFVDDAKVTDHHAIIPTPVPWPRAALAADERKIYDLICRRLLMAWHDDHIWAVTTLITAIASQEAAGGALIDRYHSSGTAVEQVGWKVLEVGAEQNSPQFPSTKGGEKRPASARPKRNWNGGLAGEDAEQSLPPGLTVGQPQRVAGRPRYRQADPAAAALDRGDPADRDGNRRAALWRTRNCRRR